MERDDQPNGERVSPILVTLAGVAPGDLTDEPARAFIVALQRETEASLASLLPQILAEGGQVQLDVPADRGDPEVWVFGLSPALTQAVLERV